MPILGTGLAAPLIQKNGGGVIINTARCRDCIRIASDAGLRLRPIARRNFTHSLASWASDRKSRQFICPGIVDPRWCAKA